MKLVYCDESGDPGFPKYQTPIFVQSFLYLNTNCWHECFQEILNKRREIKKKYSFPLRMEFHTREFILNKNPYTDLYLGINERVEIMEHMIDLLIILSHKSVSCINVSIIKNRLEQGTGYSLLKSSLTFGLQRIANNIHYNKNIYENFMILIDQGYIEKAVRIAREIRRYNPVPYKGSTNARQVPIQLIDDPLSKNSKSSYFIQLADFIAYVISQYIYVKLGTNASPKRAKYIEDKKIIEWVERMKPIFNYDACQNSEFNYGIFVYPKTKKDS